MALANLLLRTTSCFHTFVHPQGAMRRLIEQAGFENRWPLATARPGRARQPLSRFSAFV
jgi:hypothetical protein